jgi:hypothetical protein
MRPETAARVRELLTPENPEEAFAIAAQISSLILIAKVTGLRPWFGSTG